MANPKKSFYKARYGRGPNCREKVLVNQQTFSNFQLRELPLLIEIPSYPFSRDF